MPMCWNISAQVPGNQVAARIISGIVSDLRLLSFVAKKGHQVREAAVISIGVCEAPEAPIGIARKVGRHVLVDFLLEINSRGTINTDDLVVSAGTSQPGYGMRTYAGS